MKIFVILSFIAVFVVAGDYDQEDDKKIEPVKHYTIPSRTKLNDLDVTPINSRPYVERSRKVQSRIAGGQNVPDQKQHLFRHQVRIVAESKLNSEELSGCGGTILSDEWILTAAHCVDHSAKIRMYFGMLDDRDREYMEQRNATEEDWVLHPNWSRQTFHNDIALIKLIPKLSLTEEIHSIRLPRSNKTCTAFFGTRVTISGWGISTDLINNDDTNLKYVDVTVVRDKEECTKTWGNFVDFDTMLCVDASQKRGSCTGDSGGPMVYTQRNGLQLLIGVTSFGSKNGCETEDPRVYTCVNGFRDWIYEVTDDPKLKD